MMMRPLTVAPRAGAWIEMISTRPGIPAQPVAPRAGAWIEILYRFACEEYLVSLPVRERGLKWGSLAGFLWQASRSPCGSVD